MITMVANPAVDQVISAGLGESRVLFKIACVRWADTAFYLVGFLFAFICQYKRDNNVSHKGICTAGRRGRGQVSNQ